MSRQLGRDKCKACKGNGWIWTAVSPTVSVSLRCKVCNGTGKANKGKR